MRANEKCSSMTFIEVIICPSNGFIANAVFRYLVLNLQDHFSSGSFDKTGKMQALLLPSDRKSGIYHEMAPLWKFYIMTLTYIFKATNLEMWISKTARASENAPITTFIEVDVRHQLGPLQMFYFVTLTSIFKVTQMRREYLGNGQRYHIIATCDS